MTRRRRGNRSARRRYAITGGAAGPRGHPARLDRQPAVADRPLTDERERQPPVAVLTPPRPPAVAHPERAGEPRPARPVVVIADEQHHVRAEERFPGTRDRKDPVGERPGRREVQRNLEDDGNAHRERLLQQREEPFPPGRVTHVTRVTREPPELQPRRARRVHLLGRVVVDPAQVQRPARLVGQAVAGPGGEAEEDVRAVAVEIPAEPAGEAVVEEQRRLELPPLGPPRVVGGHGGDHRGGAQRLFALVDDGGEASLDGRRRRWEPRPRRAARRPRRCQRGPRGAESALDRDLPAGHPACPARASRPA